MPHFGFGIIRLSGGPDGVGLIVAWNRFAIGSADVDDHPDGAALYTTTSSPTGSACPGAPRVPSGSRRKTVWLIRTDVQPTMRISESETLWSSSVVSRKQPGSIDGHRHARFLRGTIPWCTQPEMRVA